MNFEIINQAYYESILTKEAQGFCEEELHWSNFDFVKKLGEANEGYIVSYDTVGGMAWFDVVEVKKDNTVILTFKSTGK